nr:zinc finger, CCHC-type [Tanacetum cinerariifolium]
MRDENSICTLGDYSKHSHEGYRNTIELLVWNNVVPIQSDAIRLVQNRCSFHELRSEDPNQHLKNFLKLVDSLGLNGENKETTRLCLFQFSLRDQMFQQHHGESLYEAWTHFKDLLQKVPHHRIDLWLQVQIFYDRIDHTLKRTIDYATEGQLRKLSAEKDWATIEELARYEDEGWNGLVAPGKGSLDYENPDIKQLLRLMKCKVDTLIKEAISLM